MNSCIRAILVALLFSVFAFSPARAGCGDAISNQLIVEVPSGSGAVERALVVRNTVLQRMETFEPKSARCGTVVYNIRVTLKVGPFVFIPLLPFVGEIKDDEDWNDLLPSLINERFGVEDTIESDQQTNSCIGCTSVSVDGVDSAGSPVEVRVTYWGTFSCSGSVCTLTLGVLSVQVFNADGTHYYGPGVTELFAGTTYGGGYSGVP